MRLFTETEHGLEPLWLWLTEGGTPMAYESWEKVFDAANARVAAVFAAATRQDGRRRTAIACSPHMMRHSFALYMLGAASRAGPPVRADTGGAPAFPTGVRRPVGAGP
jgi:hypothetical protein